MLLATATTLGMTVDSFLAQACLGTKLRASLCQQTNQNRRGICDGHKKSEFRLTMVLLPHCLQHLGSTDRLRSSYQPPQYCLSLRVRLNIAMMDVVSGVAVSLQC